MCLLCNVFVLSYDAVHYIDMSCQEENYLLPVVCAIFKKVSWNGGRMITSNGLPQKKVSKNNVR